MRESLWTLSINLIKQHIRECGETLSTNLLEQVSLIKLISTEGQQKAPTLILKRTTVKSQ